VGEVGDLIGPQGAAAAGMLGPTEHPGLEEGAVYDELTAALEQVDEARLAARANELIRVLHGHPRPPPTLGGQRVTGSEHGLLFRQELLASSVPVLPRNDRGRVLH